MVFGQDQLRVNSAEKGSGGNFRKVDIWKQEFCDLKYFLLKQLYVI